MQTIPLKMRTDTGPEAHDTDCRCRPYRLRCGRIQGARRMIRDSDADTIQDPEEERYRFVTRIIQIQRGRLMQGSWEVVHMCASR